jgi:hypothetical protein
VELLLLLRFKASVVNLDLLVEENVCFLGGENLGVERVDGLYSLIVVLVPGLCVRRA